MRMNSAWLGQRSLWGPGSSDVKKRSQKVTFLRQQTDVSIPKNRIKEKRNQQLTWARRHRELIRRLLLHAAHHPERRKWNRRMFGQNDDGSSASSACGGGIVLRRRGRAAGDACGAPEAGGGGTSTSAAKPRVAGTRPDTRCQSSPLQFVSTPSRFTPPQTPRCPLQPPGPGSGASRPHEPADVRRKEQEDAAACVYNGNVCLLKESHL